MGRIPEYQRQSFASSVQTSMIDRAGDTAQFVGSVANAGFQIALKRQEIQKEKYVAEKSIELESRSTEIFDQWQKEHEADPIGKEEDLKNRLSALRSEILGAAPTGSAQEEFGQVTDKYYSQVYQRAGNWQDEQLKKNTIVSTESGLDALRTKMLRNPNPGNFDTLMAEAEMVISPMKLAAGTAAADQVRNQYSQNLSLTMFQSLVEKNNVSGAKQLLDSQKYDQHLGSEGIQKVQQLIDIRQKQNVEQAKKIDELKFKNPWDYYLHQGGKANVIAFDPAQDPSGASLKNTLLQRQSIMLDAKQQYGIDLPLFRPQEADGLIRQLKNTGTKETLDFFSFYDKNITDEQKLLISQQVFEKEPSMGIALAISNDAPEDAQRVITGTKLLRQDPSKVQAVFTPKSGQNDMDATFDAYIGNATEDANFRRQTRDAAMAHYTTMALRSDKAVNSFDPELFKQSIAAVSAPVFDYNGRNVFSFRNKEGKFIEQDEFEDFTERIDDQMVEKIHGDVPRTSTGEAVNLSKAGDQLSYIPANAGQYYVLFKGRATVNKSGQPFVLNMKDLYDKNPSTSFWDKVWK